jgi:predicted aspartyl protease
VTRTVVVAAVLLAATSPAAGALYRWVDAAGVVHYTGDRAAIPEAFRKAAEELDHPSARAPQPAASPASPSASPSPGTVVPLPVGGPIMVDALLNGVLLRLLLDTGADRTVISPIALSRAGIDATRGAPFRISGVTGSSPASLVSVPRLDIAGTQVGPLGVVAFAVPGDVDGLLGRDVLDAFTVTFDAAQNRATLTPR